jgi:hypothetical protein
MLIRHDFEVNYCLDGGHFELSHDSLHAIVIINRDDYITSDLNKPFPIRISAQLPEISDISFDDYDKLTINTTCDFYTVDGQLIFREIASKIMTRSQVELLQRENHIGDNKMQTFFQRNIMIKINRDNNDTSNNKSIMVVSLENEDGRWIEIGTVEINTDVVEIRGSIEKRISGSASTTCKSTLITGISSERMADGSYGNWGKYILLKSF